MDHQLRPVQRDAVARLCGHSEVTPMKQSIDMGSGNQGLLHALESGPSGYRAARTRIIRAVANVIAGVRCGWRPIAPRPWLVFGLRHPYPDPMTARSDSSARTLQSNPRHMAGGGSQTHAALLAELASRYLWWLTPDEAAAMPARVMAQVMNLGDYSDVQRLAEAVGDDHLRAVLAGADAGWFDERSWAYWHYRLGLAEPEQVPPLPHRQFV